MVISEETIREVEELERRRQRDGQIKETFPNASSYQTYLIERIMSDLGFTAEQVRNLLLGLCGVCER